MEFMPMLSGAIHSFKVYQDLFAPDIDYDILNLQADFRELQAQAVKNAVEEEVNLMREEFIAAIGGAQYGAARRGVKVGEGNVAENIEMSSEAMGKDIQRARKNADFKAQQLGAEAGRLRKGAARVKEIGGAERVASAAGSASKAAEAFGSQKGESKVSESDGLVTIDTTGKRKKKKKNAGILTDSIYRPGNLMRGV